MADLRSGLARRDFLRIGLAASSASLAAACGWDGGTLLRPSLLAVSRLNDRLGSVLHSNARLAREYPISARSRLVPSYFVSPEVPVLERPDEWRLQIGGSVRRPLALSLDDLRRLPTLRSTVKHHCVEGWTTVATWAGVPLSTIAALAEPAAAAAFVRFDTFDTNRAGVGYYNGWDLESAMHPQTIIAHSFNDRPLMPAHGAPARLYSPVKLGYKLTKYLTRITFTGERPGGYWEDQGYPWLAGI
jgi:DMSO/TMAO reductase YedYZ molybdopterin-dependent catalytic subunit